jgi:hypothetical protein
VLVRCVERRRTRSRRHHVELEEGDRVVHATRPEQPVPEQVWLCVLRRGDTLSMERWAGGGAGRAPLGARERDAGKHGKREVQRHDSRLMRRHDVRVPHRREGRSRGAVQGGREVGSVSENRQPQDSMGSQGLP